MDVMEDHDDFGGLHRDLLATGAVMNRRGMLRLASRFGLGASALALLGCDGKNPTSPTTTTTDTTTTTTTTGGTGSGGSTQSCVTKVPEETNGPYPADGSNGVSVLGTTGVVRSDIRSSFGGLSGTAAGIPLVVQLTLVSASTCSPLSGRAVYIWHCDRGGNYSLYSQAAVSQNYLRGIQECDASGRVTFVSIFPACYSGRWPHIHFEVYPSVATATSAANRQATSQIALPKDVCDAVYATSGYEASVRNLSQVSLATDNVFSDGSSLELATVTGSVAGGYTAVLTVAV